MNKFSNTFGLFGIDCISLSIGIFSANLTTASFSLSELPLIQKSFADKLLKKMCAGLYLRYLNIFPIEPSIPMTTFITSPIYLSLIAFET